jgi:hypothetical protein
MKGLFFILFLISANAYCTVSAASIVVMNGAIAASNARNANNQNQKIITTGLSLFEGVIVCNAYRVDANENGDIYEGCRLPGWRSASLTIEDYFERNKPRKNAVITGVIFDRYNREFQIYYK